MLLGASCKLTDKTYKTHVAKVDGLDGEVEDPPSLQRSLSTLAGARERVSGELTMAKVILTGKPLCK